MKRIRIDLKRYNGLPVYLGRQGENLARELCFDCEVFARQYGAGTAVLLAIRPGDSLLYPCAATQEGNTLVWQITNADTSKTGQGALVLRWYVNDSLAKSATIPTRVENTPDITDEDAPDAYHGWIEQVLRAGVTATEKAYEAGTSAENAASSAAESERQANLSAESAYASERSAQVSASSARESESSAKNAAQYESNAAASERASANSAGEAAESERKAKISEDNAAESERLAGEHMNAAAESAREAKLSEDNASDSERNAHTSEENAKASADAAEADAQRARASEQAAKVSENHAKTSETNSRSSETTAAQALSDLLAVIGTDIASLVGGKIPMNQIPATATQEIYVVQNESELITLDAQRGDLAELVETVDGERTITKTWQCLGDVTDRENWVVWGTSYAVQAGNAQIAHNAVDATMINGHRLVQIPWEQWESAVKDPDTYYLVYTEEAK